MSIEDSAGGSSRRIREAANPTPDKGLGQWFAENRSNFVRRICHRLAHDFKLHMSPEDIAQEAYVRAQKRVDSFREGDDWGPWLRTIAVNLATDAVRHEAVAQQRYRELKHLRQTLYPDYPHDSEGQVHASIQGGELRQIMGSLLPDQQELLRLHYWDGLSQSEIGEKLGIPLGTVKSRIRAAVEYLRKLSVPQ